MADGWDTFLPRSARQSLCAPPRADPRGCDACRLREECPWCPAYAYLEHRRYTSRIPYLCGVARARRAFIHRWRARHSRHYRIAGIRVIVESDAPFRSATFTPAIEQFRVPLDAGLVGHRSAPHADTDEPIILAHHATLPPEPAAGWGRVVYRRAPWCITRLGRAWVYRGLGARDAPPDRVAVFNERHTRGHIYHRDGAWPRQGPWPSVTRFNSDYVVLARVLAARHACCFHAAGLAFNEGGALFVGHSSAGKSTVARLLQPLGAVLSDERVIVRRWPDGFFAHGTWSHGTFPATSPREAPLRVIFFLEKSRIHRIVPMASRREVARLLLGLIIRPLTTADWWEKMLALMERLVREVPAYRLQFDRSGRVRETMAAWLKAE